MPLRVLVIGGGMYVTGKGCSDYRGTIGPALIEAARHNFVGEILIYASSETSTDKSVELLRETAKIMGVKVSIQSVLSLTKLFNEQYMPDCAVVSVPDHLHEKFVSATLAERIATLVVKPLATDFESARRLSSLSLENNTYAIVEYHKRFDKANRFIRNEYLEGKIGDLLYTIVHYSQRKSVPQIAFTNWADKTNIMSYLGVHYLDLISWITAASPVSVTAWAQYGFLRSININTYDSIQAVIEWAAPNGSKFTSTILTNWIDPNLSSAISDQSIILVGTEGRIDSDQKNRGIEYVRDKCHLLSINPYFSNIMYDDICQANVASGYGIESVMSFIKDVHLLISMDETADSLRKKGRPTFTNILSTYQILSACNTSIYLGKKVDLTIDESTN